MAAGGGGPQHVRVAKVLSQITDVPDGQKSGIPLRLRFFSEISVFWDLAFGVAGPIGRSFVNAAF